MEANNAAYSRRIDSTGPSADGAIRTTSDELGWMNKRADRPGDRRNDVPDEETSATSTSTSPAVLDPMPDTVFQHWKENLFTAARISSGPAHDENDDGGDHPQMLKTSLVSDPATVNILESVHV